MADRKAASLAKMNTTKKGNVFSIHCKYSSLIDMINNRRSNILRFPP